MRNFKLDRDTANVAITPDPLYARYRVYIRDIYPFIALRTRGKFKNLFIFEYHKDYISKYGTIPSPYPNGPNHQFTMLGFKVDKLYYPYNPRTEKQMTWRSYFTKGKLTWDEMGPFWRSEYVRMARNRMTGFNKFMSFYLHQMRDLYY